MTQFGTPSLTTEVREVGSDNPHVRSHLESFYERTSEFPRFVEEFRPEHEVNDPNFLYHAEGPIYVHVHGDRGRDPVADYLEPSLPEDKRHLLDEIQDEILERATLKPAPLGTDEFVDYLDEMLREVCVIGDEPDDDAGIARRLVDTVEGSLYETFYVDELTFRRLRYLLRRDIVGLGPIEPVMKDTYNEDIHILGPDQIDVEHDLFGMLNTSLTFGDLDRYKDWLQNIGERMQTPVSDKNPIIDSTLPDGSRINIVYSDDISVKGPTVTIRQSDELPFSILELVEFGTFSPELAAYMWLCLEADASVFVVGETASGKTTSLNALLSFIPRGSKIYTAEDTAEVKPPHETWQQLLTRENGEDDSMDVEMFDLVATALRSRPDYIVIGEVRGREAQMAFQAAQTGHPIMLTFHADSIGAMIDRFTGEPINVPEPFLDNADVALFQNRVRYEGEIERRVTSVSEIEAYSEEAGGIITREAFRWDGQTDEIEFNLRNNSHLLESKVARLKGYDDPRMVYEELDRRAEVIRRLVDDGLSGYHDTNDAIATFQRDGVESLPIDLSGVVGAG